MLVKGFTLRILTVACSLGLLCSSGCSKPADPPKEPAGIPQISQQALDSIREYRDGAIKRSRMTNELGDERTRAIDEAVKQ